MANINAHPLLKLKKKKKDSTVILKKKGLLTRVLMFVMYKINFFNTYLINKVNDVRVI